MILKNRVRLLSKVFSITLENKEKILTRESPSATIVLDGIPVTLRSKTGWPSRLRGGFFMGRNRKFRDYDELLHYLIKEKNLFIKSDEHLITKEMLKSRGYYNLVHGFRDDFYDSEKSKFHDDVTIMDLVQQQGIDMDFKNILFKYTLLFEYRFKEAIAYVISKELGINEVDYLSISNYKVRKNRRNSLKSFLSYIVKEVSKYPKFPVTHYLDCNYIIPPWIFVQNLSLNQSINWFSHFPHRLKLKVWNQLTNLNIEEIIGDYIFDNNPNISDEKWDIKDNEVRNLLNNGFSTYLYIINDFRNLVAHNGRLTHFKSNKRVNRIIYEILFQNRTPFAKKDFGNDLNAYIFALAIFLNKYDRLIFLKDINDLNKQRHSNNYFNSANLNPDIVKDINLVTHDLTNRELNREFMNMNSN